MPITGALRLCLLAEGAGELGVPTHYPLPPGAVIPAEAFGAGHELLARIAQEALRLPVGAVQFVVPLRPRGISLRGSMLLDPMRLRQALAWIGPERAPHASVVLVDADGNPGRVTAIASVVSAARPVTACAVATQEFEAWLVDDQAALNTVLRGPVPQLPNPETLAPGTAKTTLNAWVNQHRSADAPSIVRRELAAAMSIAPATQRSSSLSSELRRIVSFLQAL